MYVLVITGNGWNSIILQSEACYLHKLIVRSNMNKIFLCLSMMFSCFLYSQESSEKHILVTGGAGFLGSHLCERLIQDGHRVYCLDDLSTGSIENVEHLLSSSNFTFIQADITEPQDFTFHVDEIYNLACPASPIHYQKDPVKTFKANVFGALFVLELARKTGAKVFQSSTSEVYGDPIEHPQKEIHWGNVNPIGIRSCYDEGKRSAETLFFDYQRMYGTKIKVARIFNTYGPRMNLDDGRVVSNFIVQAVENLPITIYGQGEQTRSFCYVDDLIEGFLALMNTSDEVTGPINLGNPGEYTMIELANKVIQYTSSSSSLVFHPLPQDDPKKRKPDITLAEKILKWSPAVELDQGLQTTIEYFKKKLNSDPTESISQAA